MADDGDSDSEHEEQVLNSALASRSPLNALQRLSAYTGAASGYKGTLSLRLGSAVPLGP